jgi:hypothetical protein
VAGTRPTRNVRFCRMAVDRQRRVRPRSAYPRCVPHYGELVSSACLRTVGEHGGGADWEQSCGLNGSELHSTVSNGPAPTCGSSISAGRRDMPDIVHTDVLLEPTRTAPNGTKPQVNRTKPDRSQARSPRPLLHLGASTATPLVDSPARSARMPHTERRCSSTRAARSAARRASGAVRILRHRRSVPSCPATGRTTSLESDQKPPSPRLSLIA